MAGTAQYVNRWAFETGANAVFDALGSSQWDFNPGSDMIKTQPLLNAQGLTGSRVRDVSRTRLGPYAVAGTLTIEPSPQFFGTFLPVAMGGGTATAPTLANALPEFSLMQDKGGDVYNYPNCKVGRMTVSGRAGGLVECALDVRAKTEATDQGSFLAAALGSTLAYEPFQHADLVLTLAAGARTVLDFRLVLDNGLSARQVNSLTANEILEGERVITLEATAIFTSAEASALYGLAKDGAAGSLVLTNSTVSTTFTFSRVQIPDNGARTQGGEVVLPISAQIRGAAFADEFTVSNDITV